jgi:hypothetical protein
MMVTRRMALDGAVAPRPDERTQLPPQGSGAQTALCIQSGMTTSLLASSMIRATFFARVSGAGDCESSNFYKPLK